MDEKPVAEAEKIARKVAKIGVAVARRHVFLCADRENPKCCLLYTSPSPRDRTRSRMPSSA